MLTIIVDKNEYKIDSKMFNAMQYIVEADAIEKGHLVLMLLLRLQSLTSVKKLSNSFWKSSKPLTTTSNNLPKSRVMWLRTILANNLQVLLENSTPKNSTPCIGQSTIWRSILSENALLQLWLAECTLSPLCKSITPRKKRSDWKKSWQLRKQRSTKIDSPSSIDSDNKIIYKYFLQTFL